MAGFFDQFAALLPVPPGTFGDPPPRETERREEGEEKPDKRNGNWADCTNGGLFSQQQGLGEKIKGTSMYTKEDRDKQAAMIAQGRGQDGADMDEQEPPKQPEQQQQQEQAPVAKSQMSKPLAPIESGVEECDLCGRWKSKCRICAALFCEQCSMGEAIRMSQVRRGTVICGQCTVTLDKIPNGRIVPLAVPDVSVGPSMEADKAWKQGLLKGVSAMPTRPPPAVHSVAPRKDKEFSPEDLDNDFKYQNLFEVLFCPDLHLLSAMFEVLPEDQQGQQLLAATLRLVDRSARTEQIMKACVEMEVANTLDASTMFRRSNLSLRILKLHLQKVGAKFLQDTLGPLISKFRQECEAKRARGQSMELDTQRLTSSDNLQQNVKDLAFFAGTFFDRIKQDAPRSLPRNLCCLLHQLRVLSEARFPNSGYKVVAGLLMVRFILAAIEAPHEHGLIDMPPDPWCGRSLKLLTLTLRGLALEEEFPRDSHMAAMNPFIQSNTRSMRTMLSSVSVLTDDSWEYSDPKQVVVYSKDVPDLLRLIVNKMEIIERHAYLQEQQHEELRGSFLRLRAAVADLTYSASYSSGVGSRYGAAPPLALPYEVEDERVFADEMGGEGGDFTWNAAAEAAMQGLPTPPGSQRENNRNYGEAPMVESMLPKSVHDEVEM